jgi:hypothetical protein
MRLRPDLRDEPYSLQRLAWNKGAGVRLLAEKAKVVHNGGAPNPRDLASQIRRYLHKQRLDNLKVARVSCDRPGKGE